MRMSVYIIRRVLLLFPIIIGVMTITFVLVSSLGVTQQLISHFGAPPRQAPWLYDPTTSCANLHLPGNGSCANPYYHHFVSVLGLDKPIIVQWAYYMYNSFTFQWGRVNNNSALGSGATGNGQYAFTKYQPVTQVISYFLPYTLELAALALVLILAIAIPLGNLAAVNRNRPIDQASRVLSFSGYAMPGFLLGTLVVMAFTIGLSNISGVLIRTPWCPSGEGPFFEITGSWPSVSNCFGGLYPTWLSQGVISSPTGFPTIDAMIHGQYWLALDTVLRIILPALVITFGAVAVLLRFVRNSMLEVMNLDFIRTARAKGVPERTVVRRHAGRNSLNVTITVLGLTFAFFIGGFPVVEDVFNLHGVGLLLVNAAIYPFDFGVIFGSVILFTYLVVIANIIVDVLYAYLDPRVRLG